MPITESIYTEKFNLLKSQLSNTLLAEGVLLKNGNVVEIRSAFGTQMSDNEAASYMSGVFDIWFEQRVVRAVCKERLASEIIENYDLGCTSLGNEKEAIICMHELMSHDEAIEIMGSDPMWKSDLGFLQYDDER